MADSLAELETLAEDLVDKVKEKIEKGSEADDAIYDVVRETTHEEVEYSTEENWKLVNQFYNDRNLSDVYSIDYDHCGETNDVKLLLQQTAAVITSSVLVSILFDIILQEEDRE